MKTSSRAILSALLGAFLLPGIPLAGSEESADAAAAGKEESFFGARRFDLAVGGSEVVRFKGKLNRIDVGKSGVVELFFLSPHEMELSGLGAGFTLLTLEYADGRIETWQVVVQPTSKRDVTGLAGQLQQVLRGVPGLAIEEKEGGILLSGQVPVAYRREVQQVTGMFREVISDWVSYRVPGEEPRKSGPKPVEVVKAPEQIPQTPPQESPAQQGREERPAPDTRMSDPTVQIDAQLVEMDLTRAKNIGVQWFEKPWQMTAGGGLDISAINLIRQPGVVPLIANAHVSLSGVQAAFRALEDAGVARVLATPKLTVRSGNSASFLSGGEVPIPLVTAMSSSVEYKKFGTQLNVTPEVLPNGKIAVQIKASISSLDFKEAVNGNPTIKNREAETELTVSDGQAFVIAGLMQRQEDKNESKVPMLGDVPWVGRAFRYNTTKVRETETVILMVPRVVRAASNAEGLTTGKTMVPVALPVVAEEMNAAQAADEMKKEKSAR